MKKFIFFLLLTLNLFAIKDYGLKDIKISKEVDLSNAITQDKLIPVVLITPINSHIGGRVTAMIEINQYANKGKKVIIPRGSIAIGNYKALDTFSQERLIIEWNRIITPRGRNINMYKSTTTDSSGQNGAVGELDKRYWERYGMSLFISTLMNTLSYAGISQIASTTKSAVESQFKNELVSSYKEDTNSIVKMILKEQLRVAPVIRIKKGTRLFIQPTYDIILKY